MRILAISGSLRAVSSNTALLRAVATLAPVDVEIELWKGLGDLPHFNPDLDGATVPRRWLNSAPALKAADWRLDLEPGVRPRGSRRAQERPRLGGRQRRARRQARRAAQRVPARSMPRPP